jgi:hypothetical protein
MGPPDLMLPSTMLKTSSNQGSRMRLMSASLVAGRGTYLPNSSMTKGFPYAAACAARADSHRLNEGYQPSSPTTAVHLVQNHFLIGTF